MIEVFNLDKRYGQKQVLSDVSFVAENGLVTGFVGPNGAGKSTTMRMISQIENPDSGGALVDGQEFSKADQPLQVMGIYLGSDYLPNNMTGADYLAYVCKAGGVPKDNIPSLLQAVELLGAEGRKISSYSLGMRQRIGLAAAIAGNASNLMLDEPVNGLDPMGVQWLRGLIRSQAEAGKAVLLSSHLLSELELVADKIVMLDQGYVTTQGYLSDLSAMADSKHIILNTSDNDKVARYLVKKHVPVQASEGKLIVSGVEPQTLARVIVRNNLDLYQLEEKHITLEEMFMAKAAEAQAPQQPAYQQGTPPQQQMSQQTTQRPPQQQQQQQQQQQPHLRIQQQPAQQMPPQGQPMPPQQARSVQQTMSQPSQPPQQGQGLARDVQGKRRGGRNAR